MNKIIFISGTPGVGKTTIASKLADDLDKFYKVKLIKINDLAINNDLIIGEDKEKDYKIIDIEKLDLKLQETLNDFFINDDTSKIAIVEGHLSHFCSNPDKVIILRVNPEILKERLIKRNYNKFKINENLEAEALGVCSVESFNLHENKVNEIDCTYSSVDDIISLIKDIINDEKEFPVGKIDFMNWIIENS